MTVVDRALAAAVVRAGAPGRIRFTRRQLYYEVCRGLLPLHRLRRRVRFTLPAPVGYDRFLAALDRHGPVPGLLPDPPTRETTARETAARETAARETAARETAARETAAREAAAQDTATHDTAAQGSGLRDDVPDLYDYGLPRLLVCQDPAIAAMLLANDLHMESACPVFALRDLPLDPRLTAALQRTADAVVHVLHDAGATGYAAVDDVRTWAGELRVRSLGIRPVHAAALHLTAGPRGPRTAVDGPAELEAWELRRLRAGHTVEVAAVNPARLLRTVHRLVRGQTRTRRSSARLRQLQAAGFMTWPAA